MVNLRRHRPAVAGNHDFDRPKSSRFTGETRRATAPLGAAGQWY